MPKQVWRRERPLEGLKFSLRPSWTQRQKSSTKYQQRYSTIREQNETARLSGDYSRPVGPTFTSQCNPNVFADQGGTSNDHNNWCRKTVDTQDPLHDKDPENRNEGTSLPWQASTKNLHVATAVLHADWTLLLKDQEIVTRVPAVWASAKKANRLEGKR